MPYTAPTYRQEAFNCPHCGAFAHQRWEQRNWNLDAYEVNQIGSAKCVHCGKWSVWVLGIMVYPDSVGAPLPNVDLPEKVKEIYLEAASISSKSSRAAAALLRLAIEMLCKGFEPGAKDLNEAIGNLVEKGLPTQIQQSLDIVRVTGNKAIHAGQIDVDSPDVVSTLCDLVNLIAEYTISMPKRISTMYAGLPQRALDAIKKRDGSKT